MSANRNEQTLPTSPGSPAAPDGMTVGDAAELLAAPHARAARPAAASRPAAAPRADYRGWVTSIATQLEAATSGETANAREVARLTKLLMGKIYIYLKKKWRGWEAWGGDVEEDKLGRI